MEQGWKTEAWLLFQLAWPTFIATIAEVGLNTSSIVFLGRGGQAWDMAGAAVGISVVNTLAFAPLVGLAQAIDTMCSQAYGAKEYHKVGLFFQRGLLINLVFAIAMIGVLSGVDDRGLLKWLVPREDNAEAIRSAAVFLKFYRWGLVPLAVFDALRRYLLSQEVVYPMVMSSLFALVVNIASNYFLVSVLQWGAAGAGTSLAVSHATMMVVLVFIVLRKQIHKKTWDGWTLRAFHDLPNYLRLSIPGALQICAEWWAFEITVFIAAAFGPVQLGSHAALMNICFLNYILPMSLGSAASVRVGNFLGQGYARSAKNSAFVAVSLALGVSVAQASLLLLVRPWIAMAYSSDIATERLMYAVIPVFSIFAFTDGNQASNNGVLRGSGRQIVGAYGNLVAFLGVGLPLGSYFAFRSQFASGITGIWLGNCLSETLLVTVIYFILLRTDWDAQVLRAAERVGKLPNHDISGNGSEPLLA